MATKVTVEFLQLLDARVEEMIKPNAADASKSYDLICKLWDVLRQDTNGYFNKDFGLGDEGKRHYERLQHNMKLLHFLYGAKAK